MKSEILSLDTAAKLAKADKLEQIIEKAIEFIKNNTKGPISKTSNAYSYYLLEILKEVQDEH